MASSYSSDLKLELMATGENAGTWGDKTNNNLNLVQQAVAGFEQVTLSSGGTLALAMSDGAISNARNLVIKFATASIAASTICTIPDSIEKFYIFDATGLTNPTNLTIKTASGTGFTLDQAKIYAAYSDGTNLKEISLDTLGGTVAAANLTGTIATSQIADDAVTFAKMQDTTTNNRLLGAATAGTIGEVQVATDMIADNAVTADKLADTSVSAGSYTTANITVDAQGRITAAASGAGGANSMNLMIGQAGPSSGNYSAPANVSKFYAVAFAGGGGGGGNHQGWNRSGGSGGTGGSGMFRGSITASNNYSYSVGGGGGGGSGRNSNAGAPAGGNGGTTNVGSLFTANGGNGGQGSQTNGGGQSGQSGSSPGSYSNALSQNIFFTDTRSAGGNGGAASNNTVNNGNSGGAGGLLFYVDEQA